MTRGPPSPAPVDPAILPPITGPEAFMNAFPVSRETLDRLITYADLLTTWQRTMNLVAPKTLGEAWHRHFADSAQIVALAPARGTWVDFGAGAGFPGLVAAILRAEQGAGRVVLIESDARKCAFLAEVVRRTGVGRLIAVDIMNLRVEQAATRGKLAQVNVVSARAVAPLERLLELSQGLFGPETVGLFLKGRSVTAEVAAAEVAWRFTYRLLPSRTDKEGVVVEIRDPRPVTGPKTEG